MAARRRPPPGGPQAEGTPDSRPVSPLPPMESLAGPAERTVLSELPVFEDEAPTPVPEAPKGPAPVVPRAPPPRGTITRSGTAVPQARPTSAPRSTPARPAGAAPVPQGFEGPPARREATFVGLPVGLGGAEPAAPPASAAPPAPAAPPPAPAAPPPMAEARRRLTLPTPGAPSAPEAQSPEVPSPAPGLKLPIGGPPAAPPPAEPPPARRQGALTFQPDPSESPKPRPPLTMVVGPEAGGGATRWLAGAALAVVALVAVVFYAGSGDKPATRGSAAPAPGAVVAQAPTSVARPALPAPEPGAPPVSSALARAEQHEAPPIARKQNRRPMWPPERVEALKDPDSRPEFGGEFHPPVDYHRPYLEDEVPSTPPLLTVFTHPPGMTVKVDGQLRGRTPYVLPLTGDEKRIEVELSGAGFITQRTSLTPDKEDGAFRWNTVMALDPSVKRAPAK